MLDLPHAILNILTLFSPLFSRPVYQNAAQLFVAHILCKGRRTIADLLRVLQLNNVKNFSKFHWVLSNAKWSAFNAAKILLLEIVKLLSYENEIIIAIDTTIERRKGPKIKGLGRQRDAVRSTKEHKVLTIGLQWLVASVCVKIPGSTRSWALPFFTQLIPPKNPLSISQNEGDLRRNKKHKKLTEWVVQLPGTIRNWLGENRRFVIVGDQSFACYKIAHACLKAKANLISKLRLDSRIFDFPSPKTFRNGRPRLVGKRLPLFSQSLNDETLTWQEIEVSWYGGEKKNVLVYTRAGLWYAYGIPPVTIRWVLVKDPSGRFEPVALFSTNVEHTPEKIVEAFVSRWQLEVTFEESRRHLGIETQRQWSDKAIERTTPCLFASFSIIALMATNLAREKNEEITTQDTSWYKKDHITFSDALSYVRMGILKRKYFSKISRTSKLRKFDIEELILQASAA